MNSDKGPWLTFLAVVVGYTFLFPFLPVLILSGAGPGSGLVNWLCANLAGTYMLYSFLFLYAGFVLLAVVVDRKLALGGFASFPFVLGLALVLTGLAVNVNVLFVGYVYLVDVGPTALWGTWTWIPSGSFPACLGTSPRTLCWLA